MPIQQPVSDPIAMTRISPTHHTFRSKSAAASSSSTIVSRPKHGRKSSCRGRSLSSVNLHPYDINGESSNSPYYKGLTDQSLAILDHASIPAPAPAPTPVVAHPTPPPTPTHPTSPYYKGLTDYSLVIGASWSPVLHNHPHPATPTKSLSYECSPYYRGLIDYSLALHAPPPSLPSDASSLAPPHTYSSLLSINRGLTTKTDYTLKELIAKGDHEDKDEDDLGLLIEENPLKETVSELETRSKRGSVLEEIADKAVLEEEKPMDLMTKGVDDIHSVVGLVIEEKPLRETVSEASQLGSLLEESTEKTSVEDMELTTKGVDQDDDAVRLSIEEKPLRERVSEESMGGSALEENALEEMQLMAKGMDDGKVELVMEEKPLRERVADAEASEIEENAGETILKGMGLEEEEELRDRPRLSASEQTAASDNLKDTGEEGNVYGYIWAAKYQPMTLADFICNRDKALELQDLVRKGCGCDHFIFEGPPSVGKRSMIRAMLRENFGPEKVQVIEECKDFHLRGEMVDRIQVRIKKSLHHVEVNLSETKGYEKHVIVDLFKETYGKIISNSLPCGPENCQAIILYEAEKLSTESLLYIKWLLEKYKGCNKVFFCCCSDESRLQHVKPLCITIRLKPPSAQEIIEVLEYIGKEERIKLSRDFVKKIILRSRNNLRQAIRSLEATCRNKDALEDDDLILTGWEDDILNIAKNIIEEQSPRQLYSIRGKLQSLMIHDVPPDFIYKSLVTQLSALVDDSLRSGVAKLDKEYNKGSEIKFETMKQFGHAQNKQGASDERSNESTKKNALSYLKVEEFIAKFMSWYKNSSEKK